MNKKLMKMLVIILIGYFSYCFRLYLFGLIDQS